MLLVKGSKRIHSRMKKTGDYAFFRTQITSNDIKTASSVGRRVVEVQVAMLHVVHNDQVRNLPFFSPGFIPVHYLGKKSTNLNCILLRSDENTKRRGCRSQKQLLVASTLVITRHHIVQVIQPTPSADSAQALLIFFPRRKKNGVF